MEVVSFTLCTKDSCCPLVEIEGERVKISDDYGGSVQLLKSEVELLIEKFAAMKKQ